MKPSLLEKTLPSLITKKASVYITGAPGGGKTSLVHQVTKAMNYDLIEKHVPTMLVEDFGIPWMNADGKTFDYRMPDWYPFEGKVGLAKNGVLLLDDRGQAAADIQKVIRNIQLARHLHGVPLADGWSVVATGNRVQDRAGASRVLGHLADAEVEISFDTNLDDSCTWAFNNNIHPAIIAFWRFKDSALHDYDATRDKNTTPRGWCDPKDGINALIGNVPPEAELEIFQGRIGQGHGVEFKAFMDMYRKLPSVDAILLNPDTHVVPKEGSVLYALSGSIARKASDTNFSRVMQYANRMPPEFTVLIVKDALKLTPEIASNPDFVKWAAVNGKDILF